MTKELSPKGPDWFIVCCALVTIALLTTHSWNVSENIYYDPGLFWPFSIIVIVMMLVVYLMCRVIAYEFCGKSDD